MLHGLLAQQPVHEMLASVSKKARCALLDWRAMSTAPTADTSVAPSTHHRTLRHVCLIRRILSSMLGGGRNRVGDGSPKSGHLKTGVGLSPARAFQRCRHR